MHHLQHFLSQYENIAIVPDGLRVTLPGIPHQTFPFTIFDSEETTSTLS